jgi:ParB-like chromosome segregation protein Spo0J
MPIFSAEQFKNIYKPSEYGEHWNEVPQSRLFHMRMTPDALNAMENSIKSEGIQVPVKVDRMVGKVVDGHHRAAIALRHGLSIPVEYKKAEE